RPEAAKSLHLHDFSRISPSAPRCVVRTIDALQGVIHMFRLSVVLTALILFASPCRSEEPQKLADCLRRLDHEDADERAEAARLVGRLTSQMLEDMKAETLQTGRLTARDQPFSLRRCTEQTRAALEALRVALRDRRTLVRAQAAAALAEVASRFHAVAAATPAALA